MEKPDSTEDMHTHPGSTSSSHIPRVHHNHKAENTITEHDTLHSEEHRENADDTATDLQILLRSMSQLREDFDTKVKYDESKERLIDSLHNELQIHREGLDHRLLRPILLDLIMLYDEFDTMISHAQSRPASTSETASLLHSLVIFQESIEEILYRYGAEPFTVEQETFLPSQQRSVRVVTTTDQAREKRIARRIHKGFSYAGKVLRPELVETYRYIAGSQS